MSAGRAQYDVADVVRRESWWDGNLGRTVRLALILSALPLLATFAFMVVEGWNFFDSLYMAVITLTTVGYHEVHELSSAGRVLVMVYLVVGLGVFLYSVSQIGESLLRVQIGDLLGRKRMSSTIQALERHVVVCGFGRMGRSLCRQLASDDQHEFVVIDRDADAIAMARDCGYHALVGDATDDDLLRDAGIERASGLAVVLPSDADNLFVVMSARLLRPDVQIIARATSEPTAAKLSRAGADRVVSLYETGATKMVQLLTNAQLVDFMQILTRRGSRLEVAEFTVPDDAPYCGKLLCETGLRSLGILVVGHQKPGGEVVIPPSSEARIEAGDSLITFGDANVVERLVAGETS